MEDRPDLRRLQPLTGTAAGRKLTVRVDRLHYGSDPLHDTTTLARQRLESGRPGIPPTADLPDEHACCGPRIGFDGRELPQPRGTITGLDTGGNGGTGFPSATLP